MALQGRPLDPSLGFAAWGYNANVGLGDLLVFCLYATAAYKRLRPPRRARLARASSPCSARSPRASRRCWCRGCSARTAAAFVPIMTLFGPAAFACYLWLSRSSPERPLRVWLGERAAAPARAVLERRARFGSALPAGAIAALVVATLLLSGDTTPTNAAAPPPDVPTADRAGENAGGPVRVAMRNVRFRPRPRHGKDRADDHLDQRGPCPARRRRDQGRNVRLGRPRRRQPRSRSAQPPPAPSPTSARCTRA